MTKETTAELTETIEQAKPNENVISIAPAEPTKEEKKAARKEKFKQIVKISGITLAAGAATYFLARFCNKKYKNAILVEGSKRTIDDIIFHTASSKGMNSCATRLNMIDGSYKYLTYAIVDEKPEWWDDNGEDFSFKDDVVK